MKRFTNLNTHSNSSVGKTVVTPEEIVEFAINDGAKAVALTDLDSVRGLYELSKAAEKYKNEGFKPIYGVQIFALDSDRASAPRKVTLLAKNRIGLKNIYKIISLGYANVLSDIKWPCVSYEDIRSNREGLLVGLECIKSDVHGVWMGNIQGHLDEELNELIKVEYAIADYIEIKPWQKYTGVMVGITGTICSDELEIKVILNDIAGSLKGANKLAIAFNCANCITEQDELCFNILRDYSHDIQSSSSRFLTTEEMLDMYSMPEGYSEKYSRTDMVSEIVLDNPSTIADMIEGFFLVDNERYTFTIDNADEILKKSSENALRKKYGENVPRFIVNRYESEIKNIIANSYSSYYVLASMLADKSRELGYLHNLRGYAAGSFVVYLMGISETNPLPPHYYCSNCKRVELVDAKEYCSGFDLNHCDIERIICPCCGGELVGDGHNIPVEFFAGYEGEKVPDFDFNFAPEIQKDMVEYLGEIFGENKIFYSGTECTFSYDLVKSIIADYCDKHNVQIDCDEREKIMKRLSLVNHTNGIHPGGIIVVPEDKEIFDFSPVGYHGQSQIEEKMKQATLIDCHKLSLEKIDILGYSVFSKLKIMEEMTGISARSIRLDEIDCCTFFSDDSLKAIPEFAEIVSDAIPAIKFSDLVRILGVLHGTYVGMEYGENIIEKEYDFGEPIANREDIMLTLLRHGIDRKIAYESAAMTCRGKAKKYLTDELEAYLLEHNVAKKYIESMKKTVYLFPKSHLIECMISYLRMIWYNINYPVAFYAAVLTVDAADFDYSILTEGKKRVEIEFRRVYKRLRTNQTFDCWDEKMRAEKLKDTLELILECHEKDIAFLPADINSSDTYRFLPEGGAIRLPLDRHKGKV